MTKRTSGTVLRTFITGLSLTPVQVTLLRWVLPGLCLSLIVLNTGEVSGQESAEVQRFLATYCNDCHLGDESPSGFDLSQWSSSPDSDTNLLQWQSALERVTRLEMPPDDALLPSQAERIAFARNVRRWIVDHQLERRKLYGRTRLRRLNRFEYERTVQDLLRIETPLAHLLPEETPLHGYDTVSDGLRFSALHIGRYLDAADQALDAALRFTVAPKRIKQRFLYTEQPGIRKNLKESHSVVRDIGDAAVLFTNASYIAKLHGVHFEHGGRYRIRARARGFQTDRKLTLALHVGNYKAGSTRLVGFFDVPPDRSIEVEVTPRIEHNEYLFPAPHGLRVDASGKNVWSSGGEKYGGEGLAIEWIEVEGPLGTDWPPESLRDLLGETPVVELERSRWLNGKRIGYQVSPDAGPKELADVLARFARRAFRRPISDTDVQSFLDLALDAYRKHSDFERAMRVGLRAILSSPQFLLLSEQPGVLDDYALANRLSYFLWGTMADERLNELADQRLLSRSDMLRRQTERLLNDAKCNAFVESFVGQWLDLRQIDATSPDKQLYPEFDELLKASMVLETKAFFREMLDQDLPVLNFVDSDFAMLNRRLAEHYGIPDVVGQHVHRVPLPENSPRGGLLTQASVLKVTANGTVTSPVRRGTWVQSRLLNQPPSPPPPGVGSIEPDTRGATTVREQLELHRRDPSCAGCHNSIDPPGFALECFDVIGGWRKRYRSVGEGERPQDTLYGRNIWEYKLGPAVDSSGSTIAGESFAGIREFKQLLLKRKLDVYQSVIGNLLTYATGHAIELADQEQVRELARQAADANCGLRTVIHSIVQSDLFRSK